MTEKKRKSPYDAQTEKVEPPLRLTKEANLDFLKALQNEANESLLRVGRRA